MHQLLNLEIICCKQHQHSVWCIDYDVYSLRNTSFSCVKWILRHKKKNVHWDKKKRSLTYIKVQVYVKNILERMEVLTHDIVYVRLQERVYSCTLIGRNLSRFPPGWGPKGFPLMDSLDIKHFKSFNKSPK